MKSIKRYLRWTALGLGLFIVLLAAGLGIYSNTDAFRGMVREQLVATINRSIRGVVTLDKIEGSIWGDVTLYNVRLRYLQADIIGVPQLKLAYELWPLLRGELRISRADASEPKIELSRNAEGKWNIVEAIASEEQTSGQLSLLLHSLTLHQGTLDIRLDGAQLKEFRLGNVGVDGRLTVDPRGVDFQASEISGRLHTQNLPEVNLKGALAYLDSGAVPTLKVQNLLLESAASRLTVAASVSDFAKPNIAANLVAEKLAAQDLLRFIPDWPVKQNLTGTVTAKGTLDALLVGLDLSSAGAKANGNFTLDVAAATPRYRGTIQFAGIEAREWLPQDGIAGLVSGNAEVKGVGLALEQLQGSGNVTIRSAQVKDWQLGDMRVQTKLQANTAAVSGDLKGGLGGADWRGTVTLSKVPRYDFAVSVAKLNIKKIASAAKALDGVVSFKGTIKGSGLTLAQMNTQADIAILPSTIGPISLQKGALTGSLAGGRIHIARGTLSSADTSLVVTGDIGVDLTQRGSLNYEFRSANVAPWLALAGYHGGGSLVLSGSAQGNLADVKTRGALKLANLSYDNMTVKSGAVDFDLARTAQQPIPSGVLVTRLSGVQAGIELHQLDGTVRLAEGSSAARIDLKVQDRFERIHTFQSKIDYSQTDIVVSLQQATLSLPDGTWNLVAPATLTKRGDAVSVQKLTLHNREREVSADGYLSLTGQQALNLTVSKFPLEALAAFVPMQTTITGVVALQAKVGGTAASPEIVGNLNLTDSKIGGQTYAGLVADLGYRARQASVNLTLRQDATHSLTATGKLPLTLSWHQGWRSEVAGDMDVRVKSTGLSVAFLNVYTAKTVSDIGGEISVDLTARGRPAEPWLSGSFHLSGGKFKAPSINVQINSIAADGSFDSRVVRIQSLAARANDGTFSGSGLLTLKNYQIDNVKISLAARRWPAIDTRRYHAVVGGNIDIDGSLAMPRLTGKLDVAEADLRPDLAFLERSSTAVKRDPTIVVINQDGSERPAAPLNRAGNGAGDSEIFKRLTLDLAIRIPNNFRIRHPDASAELRGNLHVTKKPNQDPQVTGNSEIIRGWAAFQGRRFDIARGDIQFIGGDKIDPTLDIVAQYRLPQYTVDAVVGGTLEKPSLVLRSNPSLEQSDILALLLFGKPSKDLNGSEQVSLKQNALDISAGFAAANIGSAISEAIGLDSLGLGDINFNGGRVGFGRYLGRRTYVTVNQEVTGDRGQEVGLEYQIAPDWKIGSTTNSKGSSGVDVIWHKRY